jgi:tRNA(Ile)-lysidine synthetase-like protein
MNTKPTIIAAISGGVDSVVMLHALATLARGEQYKVEGIKYKADKLQKRSPRYLLPATHYPMSRTRLIVAHADHGMRPDAAADARFVQALAQYYGLPYELGKLDIGPSASEDTARSARHGFLYRVSHQYGDALIATAHHQDDLLETAIINLLRGTGRHGLSSMLANEHYIRPILNWDRAETYTYAAQHRLEWVEDETNECDRFLRNRVRSRLIPQLKQSGGDKKVLEIVKWFARHNAVIDEQVSALLDSLSENTSDHLALNRQAFAAQTEQIRPALTHFLLRKLGVQELDRQLVTDIQRFVCEAAPGKQFVQATPIQIVQTMDWTLFKPSY